MTQRGLDHLVMPVKDLDAAAQHYGALGFLVGAENRHPWGTCNRLVQFPGSFLELISLAPDVPKPPAPASGEFGFGQFVAAHLSRQGNGIAMLALETSDAVADAAAFARAGLGGFAPFFFERRGRRADGSEVRVAFSLAFAADNEGMPRAGFFTCQQHEPQNFWSAALQAHPNGALGLKGIVMLAERPAALQPFLQAFCGAAPICAGERNIAFVTPRGSIEAMTPACFVDTIGDEALPGLDSGAVFAAFKISAPLEAFSAQLAAAGIAHHRHRRHLVVAAADNFGAALVVEEPRAA